MQLLGWTPLRNCRAPVLTRPIIARAQLNFALVIPEASRAPGACGSCPGGALANLNCRAWNATPALAPTRSGIFGLGDATPVDDSAYIMDVLAAIKAKFAVDETRIFAAGADAGGFMAYRMACEQPDTFAAVMSLNGAMVGWNSSQCAAFGGDSSVSVLEVHGMKDTEVPYEGGSFEGAPVPGAAESALLWAQHNGCSAISNGTALELLRHGPFTGGADTEVVDFTACDGGSAVSLWSVDSLRHDVTDTTFTADFARKVMAFFAAHPKGGLPAPAPAQAVGTLSVQSAAPAPAPAASRSSPPPARLVKSPPPPSPPTLLNRIRASLEARNAAALAGAPAPATLLRARAPAPAPAMRELTVNALSGPPGAQEEEAGACLPDLDCCPASPRFAACKEALSLTCDLVRCPAGEAPVEFQQVPSPSPAVVAPSPSPSPSAMPTTVRIPFLSIAPLCASLTLHVRAADGPHDALSADGHPQRPGRPAHAHRLRTERQHHDPG